MENPNKTFCEHILLSVICHEICRNRLSPEMKFIFEKHLESCPDCRRRISFFFSLLREEEVVCNYG